MYPRIRHMREDKDLAQADLAKVLHMTQSGYSRYEIGKNDIPTQVLKTLAIFHNTSVDYLLELTDNPEPYERKKIK